VYVGFLLFLSYLGGQIANALKTPRVVGYLIIGMLLSPSVSGLLQERMVKEELSLITDIALATIAFSIGGSLELPKLQRLGKQFFWITCTQGFGAFLLGTIVLAVCLPVLYDSGTTAHAFWSVYFPVALVIGAICAATAPAAILAIVHEYRAQGTFTTMLLGVIALDDGLTIVLYAFASSIAHSLMQHENISLQNMLLMPSAAILLSLSLGGVVGAGLRKLIRFVSRREAMLGVMIGCIFVISGLAISLQVSPLLANMMFGFVVVNFVEHHEDLFAVVESIEEPIFGMFFTLAGAHLDLWRIQSAGWLALLITLGRFAGKLLGSRFGAHVSDAPESIKKYLGLALLPAAGVTVGLVLEAKDIFASISLGDVIVSGVLGSVMINALLAPFFVRYALFKAGEATSS
jgi:Kef-type K+ transport system membrane component KefB